MKKQIIITSVLILIIIGLISSVVIGSKKKSPSVINNPEIEITTTSPAILDADIFYWGETCPNCHNAIDWMKENKVDQQIKVIKKEIYENKKNANELIQNAKDCGINENEIGVPFMFTKDQRCLVGTPDIISYLEGELDKINNNNEVIN